MDKTISKETMNFSFEGGYEVSASTVSKTIDSLVDMVEAIAKDSFSETEFRLSVSAVRPGSVILDFNAIAFAAQSLLTPSNINFATAMINALIACVNVKLHLGGKAPKKVEVQNDTLQVENSEQKILEVPAAAKVYFENVTIENSIINIFQSADQDEGISGLSIRKSNGDKISVPREKFTDYIVPTDFESSDNATVEYRKRELLFIRKPDLTGDTKWEFRSDRPIIADIKDTEFLNDVHAGKVMICAGTSILAELIVRMAMKADGMPDTKTARYTVEKVLQVNMPGLNGQFDLLE